MRELLSDFRINFSGPRATSTHFFMAVSESLHSLLHIITLTLSLTLTFTLTLTLTLTLTIRICLFEGLTQTQSAVYVHVAIFFEPISDAYVRATSAPIHHF